MGIQNNHKAKGRRKPTLSPWPLGWPYSHCKHYKGGKHHLGHTGTYMDTTNTGALKIYKGSNMYSFQLNLSTQMIEIVKDGYVEYEIPKAVIGLFSFELSRVVQGYAPYKMVRHLEPGDFIESL